ncbi:MAG: orotidine-5'-phosphate decarboxylase [Nitrospirales bacterium]
MVYSRPSNTQNLKPQERLIFALDVADMQSAKSYVKQLKGVVSFYKVGWELFLAESLEIVKYLKGEGHKVFLDLKIQDDVDATISRYIQVAIRQDVDFVTLHGNGRMFATAKSAKGGSNLKILSLTLLSNMDEAAMKDNYMLQNGDDYCLPFKTAEEYVGWRATKTFNAGCDGFIASGRFVKFLKNLFKEDCPLIITPGVRPVGCSAAEHKNVLTPKAAIQNGSDYLVVGRPIRDAENANSQAQAIVQQIAEGLESPASA